MAQLKPFNPILGETFQCKIENSELYIEQTSHHPPIFNYLIKGENFKIYGYNEFEIISGVNTVKSKYKGNYKVEFLNGIVHKIYFPQFKLSGLLYGNRTINYSGHMVVSDEKNDLISFISMNPDDRGLIKKIFTKKIPTNPDYFKGIITSISKNSKFDEKSKCYTDVDFNKHVFASIEGEFSCYIKFDDIVYWEYDTCQHPTFYRMYFTLPSDSTFREDLNWLKNKNYDMAQKSKIKLEEIQRNDKKLRYKIKK